MNDYNITWLVRFLKQNNIRLKSSLSQNFLIDMNIVKKIVNSISPTEKAIIEIGPGVGAITGLLHHTFPNNNIHAIEIDNFFAEYLDNTYPSCHVHHQDVLTFDFNSLSKSGPMTILGNIPFGIASKILQKILPYNNHYSEIIIVVQKEYGERLIALPGNKHYGRLSIFTQLWCDVKKLFNISKHCFLPVPNVDSMVCKLSPHHLYDKQTVNIVEEVTKKAFHQRRKRIVTTLQGMFNKDILESFIHKHNIDTNARSDHLSVNNYIELAKLWIELYS